MKRYLGLIIICWGISVVGAYLFADHEAGLREYCKGWGASQENVLVKVEEARKAERRITKGEIEALWGVDQTASYNRGFLNGWELSNYLWKERPEKVLMYVSMVTYRNKSRDKEGGTFDTNWEIQKLLDEIRASYVVRDVRTLEHPGR